MGALKLIDYEAKNPLKVVYSKTLAERKSVQRFLSTDPNAEFYSPYEAMGNNPVSMVDPDGGSTDDYYGDGKGGVIYVPSSAPTVEVGGQTFTNIGTTYERTINGVNEKYVQNTLTSISFVDEGMLTFKVANFAFTLANAYWDKTAATFEAVGEVPKFVPKISRGFSIVNAGLAITDAGLDIYENGLTFRSGTKAALGVGLVAAGIVAAFSAPAWAPALAIAGLAYNVADYYGGVDATLNLIHRTYYKNMGITVKDQ